MDRNSSTVERRISMNTSRLANPMAESTCLNGSPNAASPSHWFGSHSPRISDIPRSNSTACISRVRSVTPTRTLNNTSYMMNPNRQKLNLRSIDPRIYADVNSSGLVSRVVKYQDNNNKQQLQRSMSVNNLYNKPGQFPVVHLKKKEMSYKACRNNVKMTRIAPPDHSIYYGDTLSGLLRSNSIVGLHKTDEELSCENRPILHPPPTESDLAPTRSVIEVLKEISRKRINTNDLQHAEASQKKSCNREYDDLVDAARANPNTDLTTVAASQSYKRQREVMNQQHQTMHVYPMLDLHSVGLNHMHHTSPEQQQQAKRRQCSYNNDITSSLSSSQKQYTNKRKLEQKRAAGGLNQSHHRTTTSSGGSNNSSPETETHVAKIQRKQNELRFERLPPRSLNCTMPITPLPATPYYSQNVQLNSRESTTDNDVTCSAKRAVSAPVVSESKTSSPTPSVSVVNVVSSKPKVTLFNKDYEDESNNDQASDLENSDATEPRECAGINFVKPKKFDSTSKGRNPIIERTQKSKLALMLSGLRGEIYQGEALPNEDDLDGIDLNKSGAEESESSRLKENDKPIILSVLTIPAKPMEDNKSPASLVSGTVTTTATTTIPTSSIQGITPKLNFGTPTSSISIGAVTQPATTATFSFGLAKSKDAAPTAVTGTSTAITTVTTTATTTTSSRLENALSFGIPSSTTIAAATAPPSSLNITTSATNITATPTPAFSLGLAATTTNSSLNFGGGVGTTTTTATSDSSAFVTPAAGQTLTGFGTPMKPMFSFGKPTATDSSNTTGGTNAPQVTSSSTTFGTPVTAAAAEPAKTFSFGANNATLNTNTASGTNASSLIAFSPTPAAPVPTFGNTQSQVAPKFGADSSNLMNFSSLGGAAAASSATTSATTATTSNNGLFSFGAGTAASKPAATASAGGFSFAGALKNSTTTTTTTSTTTNSSGSNGLFSFGGVTNPNAGAAATTTTATLATNSGSTGSNIFGFGQKPAAVANQFAFGANNTNSSNNTTPAANGGGTNSTFSFGGAAGATQPNANTSAPTATFSFGGNTANTAAAPQTNGNTNATGASAFTFGGSTATKTAVTPQTNGNANATAASTFSFGGSTTGNTSSTNISPAANTTIKPFSFGKNAAATPSQQSNSIFGNSNVVDKTQQQNTKPASGNIFAFGGNAHNQPAGSTTAANTSKSIFGTSQNTIQQGTNNNTTSAPATAPSSFSFGGGGGGTQTNIFGGSGSTAAAAPITSNTSSSPFSFGSQNANKPAAQAAGGFSFSASLAGANNTNNAPAPSIFGNASANVTSPAKPSFSFGGASGNSATNMGATSFGSLAASAGGGGGTNNSFAFGSANATNATSSATSNSIFGSSNTSITPIKPIGASAPGVSGGFSFGNTASNAISSTNNTGSTAAGAPFSFGSSATNSNANAAVKPFAFGTAASTGSNLFDNKQQSTVNPGANAFSFGAPIATPANNIFAPPPPSPANVPGERPMRRATRRLQK